MNLDRLFGFSAATPASARQSQLVKPGTLFPALLALMIPMRAFSQDPSSELLEAAKKGDIDALRSILGKGGNINAKSTNGRTGLMEAAYWGRTDAAKLFLEKGADTNAKDQ